MRCQTSSARSWGASKPSYHFQYLRWYDLKNSSLGIPLLFLRAVRTVPYTGIPFFIWVYFVTFPFVWTFFSSRATAAFLNLSLLGLIERATASARFASGASIGVGDRYLWLHTAVRNKSGVEVHVYAATVEKIIEVSHTTNSCCLHRCNEHCFVALWIAEKNEKC